MENRRSGTEIEGFGTPKSKIRGPKPINTRIEKEKQNTQTGKGSPDRKPKQRTKVRIKHETNRTRKIKAEIEDQGFGIRAGRGFSPPLRLVYI